VSYRYWPFVRYGANLCKPFSPAYYRTLKYQLQRGMSIQSTSLNLGRYFVLTAEFLISSAFSIGLMKDFDRSGIA